jgi:hypothetical protein
MPEPTPEPMPEPTLEPIRLNQLQNPLSLTPMPEPTPARAYTRTDPEPFSEPTPELAHDALAESRAYTRASRL